MITKENIQEFNENGVFFIKNAVPKKEVEAFVSEIDKYMDSGEKYDTTVATEGRFSDRLLWPKKNWMYDFCRKNLPEHVGRLTESNQIRLYFDHIFIKYPSVNEPTPWHQDRPYWPMQGKKIVSVWVALEKCDINSSVLQFVKGSHNWGKIFAPTAFTSQKAGAFVEGAEGEPMPDFDSNREDYEFLYWTMAPGDCVVFYGETIHGAAMNQAKGDRRAAISIRYLGDDATWDPRPGTDPIVSQKDTFLKPGDPTIDNKNFPIVWERQTG